MVHHNAAHGTAGFFAKTTKAVTDVGYSTLLMTTMAIGLVVLAVFAIALGAAWLFYRIVDMVEEITRPPVVKTARDLVDEAAARIHANSGVRQAWIEAGLL